jgi:hypothetical protein
MERDRPVDPEARQRDVRAPVEVKGNHAAVENELGGLALDLEPHAVFQEKSDALEAFVVVRDEEVFFDGVLAVEVIASRCEMQLTDGGVTEGGKHQGRVVP